MLALLEVFLKTPAGLNGNLLGRQSGGDISVNPNKDVYHARKSLTGVKHTHVAGYYSSYWPPDPTEATPGPTMGGSIYLLCQAAVVGFPRLRSNCFCPNVRHKWMIIYRKYTSPPCKHFFLLTWCDRQPQAQGKHANMPELKRQKKKPESLEKL